MKHPGRDMSGTSDTRSGRRRHGVVRALVGVAAALAVVALLFAGGKTVNAAPPATTLAWSPTAGTSTFGYGTVSVGSTSAQQFTLTSTDGAASGGLAVTLTGSTAFTITSDSCSGTSINKGAPSCAVTVQYAPTAAGESDSAMLSASSKRSGSTSLSLSGASPAPCSVVANLWPPAGTYFPQNQLLIAEPWTVQPVEGPDFDLTGSYTTCGDPVEYIWGCVSTTSGACPSFTADANDCGSGTCLYDNGIAYIQVNAFDAIDILLTVCDRNDPSLCAPQISQVYFGAATSA